MFSLISSFVNHYWKNQLWRDNLFKTCLFSKQINFHESLQNFHLLLHFQISQKNRTQHSKLKSVTCIKVFKEEEAICYKVVDRSEKCLTEKAFVKVLNHCVFQESRLDDVFRAADQVRRGRRWNRGQDLHAHLLHHRQLPRRICSYSVRCYCYIQH